MSSMPPIHHQFSHPSPEVNRSMSPLTPISFSCQPPGSPSSFCAVCCGGCPLTNPTTPPNSQFLTPLGCWGESNIPSPRAFSPNLAIVAGWHQALRLLPRKHHPNTVRAFSHPRACGDGPIISLIPPSDPQFSQHWQILIAPVATPYFRLAHATATSICVNEWWGGVPIEWREYLGVVGGGPTPSPHSPILHTLPRLSF